ncbi:hypothetical protein COB52_02080 [Candidatus Kaiserbacteria bacterium]|nr:MAG: hypothetical protein COB52_02080 [Candidatus Kaiserbacteria bacterium]
MNKKTILIIEDEEPLLRALKDRLTNVGFKVFTEMDGDAGFVTAIREKPDLILLDIVMPKEGGLAMARRLRGDEWGKDVKIILLTNVGGIDRVQEAMELNIYEYFMKTDIEIEQVVERVKAMVGGPDEE